MTTLAGNRIAVETPWDNGAIPATGRPHTRIFDFHESAREWTQASMRKTLGSEIIGLTIVAVGSGSDVRIFREQMNSTEITFAGGKKTLN